MERNRETRRGTMNGGRLSRRRQRSSGAGGLNRDSPEDEGEMEMHETTTTTTTTRLRDRGCKKDRDRVHVRSGRNQRRRMITGGRRDDVDDSSEEEEESLDDDEEDDDGGGDDDRFQPPSVSQTHHRKSFPVRPLRVPPWKAADEIGVPIPKKARSAFAKRSPESWNSGSSSVGGEQIHHSTSPAAQILPSSSNAAARKKMKPMINGTTSKQRPPPSKISIKSTPEQEAIEMEIAEVLSKLRKQEDPSHCFESRNEERLQVSSSPNSVTPLVQPSNPSSNATSSVIAPNWKRPRPVNNFEDESPTSPLSSLALPSTLVSSATQMDTDQQARSEEISPKLEKPVQLSVNENGAAMLNFSAPQTVSAPSLTQGGPEKLDGSTVTQSTVPTAERGDRGQDDVKEEDAKRLPHIDLDEAITVKGTLAADSLQGDKFTIDLMAPPPGKSSPEREDFCHVVSNNFCRPVSQEMELFPKIDRLKKEAEAVGSMVNQNVGDISGRRAEKIVIEDLHLKKQTYKGKTPIIEDLDLKKQMAKGNTLDHHLDMEKPKQQSQAPRVELQADKTVPSSLPVSTSVAGWPGSFPSFGYVGQIPSVQPIVPAMNAAIASFSMMRPPVRQKRCSTHCFIAQSIQYHEKIMKVNPFWPSATGTAQLLGARPPYNLNVMPDALHGNPLQANIQGRSMGSLQDSQGAPILASFAGHPAKDNLLMVNANMTEAAQRKHALQQTSPQAGSANNISNPALFFPLNPHLAAVAAAARSGVANSSMVVGNATSSSGVSSSIVATSGSAHPMAAMNFGFAMPSSDAQYFAILQNNGYTYPMSAHAGGPPSYRGGSPAQAMPFVNGPFFSPQMLHHPQQQQPPPPTPISATQQDQRAQTGQQNLCTSSDSSSSHKHHQKPQRHPGAGASGAGPSSHIFQYSKQHSQLQINQSRQLESDTGCEDSPSAADSRVSQAQKTLSGQNLAMLSYPQNIGMMSPAATAAGSSSGANHSEKQPTQQQQQPAMKVDLTPSQAFAMSFMSMNGGVPPSGIDFSSMAQNHAMFQSLQEATRHGYPMPTAAVAGISTQEKKSHLHAIEAGRSAGNSFINLDNAAEEKKILATRKAPVPHGSHHSFSFSKSDKETIMNTNASNNIVDGPSQVNLEPSSTSSSRTSNRPSNAASTPATTSVPSAPLGNPTFQQFQLQKQARELQLEHQMASARTKPSASGNNAVAYSEHLPLGSLAKFPQTSTGFPQGLIQGGSSGQSPKWKTSGRMGAPTVTAADLLVGKNNPLQQQGGATFTPNHQISFGPNAVKSTPAGTEHLAGSGTNNVSASSTAAASAVAAVVSPSNSVSKSTGGSLRASTNVKPAPTANTTALHQQSSSKSSASSSSRNSSPKHNAPSILGQPQHTNHATSSNSSKQFSQLQQSRLQPQPSLQKQPQTQTQPQPQLFFSNAVYMQAQAPQSSTAAASPGANLYRRQLEQQQQQQQKMVHLQQQQMSQPQQMVQQQHQQQMSQPRQIVQQMAKQQLQYQQLCQQQQQMSQQQQQQQKQPSKQQQQQQIMQMAPQQIAHQQMVQQLLQQQQMSRQQQQPQKQQSKQQQKPKQSSNPVSSGMHLSGSDHSKSTGASPATANSMKGLPPPGLMHAAQVQISAQSSASGATHTSISTAAAGFPYMSMPPASAKSSDQKPAAGNDNSNEGSW